MDRAIKEMICRGKECKHFYRIKAQDGFCFGACGKNKGRPMWMIKESECVFYQDDVDEHSADEITQMFGGE